MFEKYVNTTEEFVEKVKNLKYMNAMTPRFVNNTTICTPYSLVGFPSILLQIFMSKVHDDFTFMYVWTYNQSGNLFDNKACTFEEIFDMIPECIREKLIYDLDLFIPDKEVI